MTLKATPLDQKTFDRLRRLYILALSAIALSVILSQLLIRNHLSDQENDSRVINLAGRQRMLSQKLAKEVYSITRVNNRQQRIELTQQLQNTLELWELTHKGLQFGNDRLGLPAENSSLIDEMFQELNPYFEAIQTATIKIIAQLESNPLQSSTFFQEEVELIIKNESQFLSKMDLIVDQYDREANDKVIKLSKLELLMMTLSLFILLSELLFIFWPAAKSVKNTLSELLIAEKKAKKMAYDADQLSKAKETSIRELTALSDAMDQTLLFARITANGEIVHLGSKFLKLFGLSNFNTNTNFYDIISSQQGERTMIEDIIINHKNIGWQGEINTTNKRGDKLWLELAIVPFRHSSDKSELLIIAYDITKRKIAQFEIDRLNKEHFDEKMNQQKIISSKIIENQEKEQNRIAKDVHDGIGQMLTGLKYNLESIDTSNLEKTKEKISYLKELTHDIIKGVRVATFNLTPPELEDHGLVPALTKLTIELSKLTGKEIVLFNKTDFDKRLDNLMEINIYRITQEAINNAIKYANSTHIIVNISHSDQILSIGIDDNGDGFEPHKVEKIKKGDGGMGMTFMRERINYINGRFFINSKLNEGTRITLNIPLN